jgi:Tfp pilus assembly protein PilV
MTDSSTSGSTLPARRHVAAARDQSGFGLVEALIALLVFTTVIVGVAAIMSTTLHLVRSNRHRSTAAYLAASEIDQSRAVAFSELTTGRTTRTVTAQEIPFTVTRDISWTSTTAAAPCEPGGTVTDARAYLRVHVQVTWPDMTGALPMSAETLITPPVPAYSLTTGHVWVKVLGRDGQGMANLLAGLTGPRSLTTTTTEDGCAFFSDLPPGSYVVNLAVPGYADRVGSTSTQQSVSVTAGEIATVQLDYERAGTLSLTLSAPLGGQLPSDAAVTVANGSLPLGVLTVAGTGSSRAVQVFPYASGYLTWAGGCPDAEPARHGVANGPALSPGPGQTAAGTVQLGTVEVQVVDTANRAVAGVRLSAVHEGTTGCASPSGEQLQYTAVSGADGRVRLALPYGAWRMQPVGRVVSGAAPVVTVRSVSTLHSATVRVA